MAGVKLPCPLCGEENAGMKLHLDDVEFECKECDGVLTVPQLRTIISSWQRVLAWVDQLPKQIGEPG